MKRLILFGCVVLILVACKTSKSVTESRASSEERSVEAKVDSVSLQTADSVFVFIHQNDSTTHIVERQIHWRERVTLKMDTVVVNRTDTIVKTVEVRETVRDPPNPWRTLKTILFTAIVTAALVAVAILVLTLKKRKE